MLSKVCVRRSKLKIFSSAVGVNNANAPSLLRSCDFPTQNLMEAPASSHSLFETHSPL